MKLFEATLFQSGGEEQVLRLQSNTLEEVRQYLHAEGYTIGSLMEVEAVSLFQRVNRIELGQRIAPRNRIRILKALGQMIGRGYAIEKVIDFLLADEKQKDVLRLLNRLKEKTQQGYKDYVELFQSAESYFDAEFFSILVAGQKTGAVGENMVDYAEGKEKMLKQKQELIRTLSGKFVLLGIVVLAFLVIVLFVVPQFQDVFGDSLALPLGMQIMVMISESMREYALLFSLLGLGCAVVVILLYVFHERFRYWIQHFLLKTPVLGQLLRMMHTRNFLYLMGNLITKGVALMDAITIVIDQSANLCFQSVYRAIQRNLEQGRKLEQVLRPVNEQQHAAGMYAPVPAGYLLDSVAQAMTLGARGGNLGEMLTEAYYTYDVQLQSRMSLAIRIIGMVISLVTYGVIIFMIGSLALTLFRVMEDPTAFV